MPIIALLLSSFVTLLISLIAFSGPTAHAEVVIDLRSAELKSKTIITHTTAIYESHGGVRRNSMLPRVISQGVRKGKKVHVVVGDGSVEWMKIATGINAVNWMERSKVQLLQNISHYWILPFGNPERNLDNANIKDIEWAIESLEKTLDRLIVLRFDGIEASVIIDIEDGGLPAILGHWLIDNINVRLAAMKYDHVDVLLEARTRNGVRMGHHDYPTVEELKTPNQLLSKFPEQTALLIDMIHTYTDKIKYAQQKAKACDLWLKIAENSPTKPK